MSQFPAIHGRLRFAAPATRRQPLHQSAYGTYARPFARETPDGLFTRHRALILRFLFLSFRWWLFLLRLEDCVRLVRRWRFLAFLPGATCPAPVRAGSWAGIPLGAQEPRTPGDLGEPAAPQGYLAVGELPDQSPALAALLVVASGSRGVAPRAVACAPTRFACVFQEPFFDGGAGAQWSRPKTEPLKHSPTKPAVCLVGLIIAARPQLRALPPVPIASTSWPRSSIPLAGLLQLCRTPYCPAPQLGRYWFSDCPSHFSIPGKPRTAFGKAETVLKRCDAIVAVPTVARSLALAVGSPHPFYPFPAGLSLDSVAFRASLPLTLKDAIGRGGRRLVWFQLSLPCPGPQKRPARPREPLSACSAHGPPTSAWQQHQPSPEFQA